MKLTGYGQPAIALGSRPPFTSEEKMQTLIYLVQSLPCVLPKAVTFLSTTRDSPGTRKFPSYSVLRHSVQGLRFAFLRFHVARPEPHALQFLVEFLRELTRLQDTVQFAEILRVKRSNRSENGDGFTSGDFLDRIW